MDENLTHEERLVVNSELQLKKKSIVLAYVLLIFLGEFSIHRFYLGYTRSAIIRAVAYLVGGIITLIGVFADMSGDTSAPLLLGWFILGILGLLNFIDLFLIPSLIRKREERIKSEVVSDFNK